MRHAFKRCLLCSLFLTPVFALSKPSQEQPTLLVSSTNTVALDSALKRWGTLAGKDSRSGLYVLHLKKGVSADNARSTLIRSGKFDVVVKGDQDHINRKLLSDVQDHVAYLGEVKRHQAATSVKRVETELGWWGAYEYWLHNHVDRNGVFSSSPFYEGPAHRDKMPIAPVGGAHPFGATGLWSYVGPINQQGVPDRTFDGLSPVTGRINAIAVSPTSSSVIYVGAGGGGVWKTTDGGTTWTPLSDKWQTLNVSSIAIDPNAANTIYVGTGDFPQNGGTPGFGIMKSVDGGANWTNYGKATFTNVSISSILVNPNNSQILLASAGRGTGNGGIFRSINGGQTWAATDAPAASWDQLDVSAPGAARTFWATGEDPNSELVYQSTNDGLNWVQVTVPTTAAAHTSSGVACSKINPNVVYVLDPDNSATHSNNHVWKTTDGGTTWNDIVAGFPNGPDPGGQDQFYTWNQNDYNFYIGTSKIVNGATTTDGVFIGLITIVMSPNGGTTWIDISKSYGTNSTALSHVDQHSFSAVPLNANTVLFGNDGGVHKMVYNPTLGAGTFTPLNKNLFVTQFYKLAIHPTTDLKLQSGAQDNANPTTNDGTTWFNPGGGDGGYVSFDAFNPAVAYNSTQSLAINQTTDNWATTSNSITDATNYKGETTSFIPPIITANSNGAAVGFLYAGTNHLWRWDATNGWASDLGGTLLTGAANQSIQTMTTCPGDNNRIYTGSSDGLVFVTRNLGTTWTQIDAGFSGTLPIAAISPTPNNSKDVLVGINGVANGSGHIFRCTNVDITPAWNNVSGTGATGLPDVNVNAIARDPFAPTTTWYVGTDVGVFMTTNSGTTWTNLTSSFGLPNVVVNELVVSKSTNNLYAGTFGRGIWKIKLASASGALSNLFASPATVLDGNSVAVAPVLAAPAPNGGATVAVTSNNTAVVGNTSIVVPAGSYYLYKLLSTIPVATDQAVTLTATYLGSTKTAAFTVKAPNVRYFAFSPTTVVGGANSSMSVSMSGPAAPAGDVVTISADKANVLTLPASVTVPSTKYFTIQTVPTVAVLNDTTVTVTATFNGVGKTTTITVKAPTVSNMTVNAATLQGGVQGTFGYVYISSPAPAAGIKVNLSSDNAAAAPGSPTVTVAAGKTFATYTVLTNAVAAQTAVNITASYGASSKSVQLTITP